MLLLSSKAQYQHLSSASIRPEEHRSCFHEGSPSCRPSGPPAIMLRKSSELKREDREVLLDLDERGGAQSTDGYGSLHSEAFIPPRVSSPPS